MRKIAEKVESDIQTIVAHSRTKILTYGTPYNERWHTDANDDPQFPQVAIVPIESERIAIATGVVTADDIGYPIAVLMVDRVLDDPDADWDTQADVREDILAAFINQPLAGVTHSRLIRVWGCQVVPRAIIDAATLRKRNLLVSTVLFVFMARVNRD